MSKLLMVVLLFVGIIGFAHADLTILDTVVDADIVVVTGVVDNITVPVDAPMPVEEGKGEKTFNILYAVIAFLFSTFAAGHLANFFTIKPDDKPWFKFIKKIVNLWGTNWSQKAGL